MSELGLRLPLTTRPTPGGRNRCAWDILDAWGRLIATVQSDHFESTQYRCFDAEAVAALWVEAANATAEQPVEVPA